MAFQPVCCVGVVGRRRRISDCLSIGALFRNAPVIGWTTAAAAAAAAAAVAGANELES